MIIVMSARSLIMKHDYGKFVLADPISVICNDTDTGIGIGDTAGISLPKPIPIRGIADMTILKKKNYYAFTTAEAILRSEGTH